MGNKIRTLLNVISNSLNPNGYSSLVNVRSLGESTSLINSKRRKNHNRINKVMNGKIKKATN